jgi:hypothetical protein
MKLIIKKYYSTDQRCLVETRQRRDGLWEVEGFRRATESLPEAGTYIFMEPALGLVLTDTQANAEKLALETLAALSGISNENMTYQVVVTEEEISDIVTEKDASEHSEQAVLPEQRDERFKDMQSWGIDKDYKPERNPSLKDQDLVPRARIVLDKITKGGKSIYSVEVCDVLILIGKSLELKGKPVDACRYWYNASEIANNPWLGGWGTVSIELFRNLKRKNKIPNSQFEIIKPVPDLLREFISLSKKSHR